MSLRSPLMGDRLARRIPVPTVVRLPLYQRILLDTHRRRTPTISSAELAELAGVNAAKVRKDLSYLGTYGTPGTGYDVEYLLAQIERELGLDQDWPVVIVGMGNLGHALARSPGFTSGGFRVAALLDTDPAKIGDIVGDCAIGHLDDLPAIAAERRLSIGVITTPSSGAQDVLDRMVAVGITSVLNFAPTVLTAPPNVCLRNVDLSVELQVLSFYQSHPEAAGLPGESHLGR